MFLFRIFVCGWWRRGRSLGRLLPARPANRTAQKSWLLLLLDGSRSRCLRRGHRRRTLNNRLRLRRRDWRLETAVGEFAIGSVLIVTVRTLAALIAVAPTIATFALIAVDTAVIMRAPVVTIAVLTAARGVTLVAVTTIAAEILPVAAPIIAIITVETLSVATVIAIVVVPIIARRAIFVAVLIGIIEVARLLLERLLQIRLAAALSSERLLDAEFVTFLVTELIAV